MHIDVSKDVGIKIMRMLTGDFETIIQWTFLVLRSSKRMM